MDLGTLLWEYRDVLWNLPSNWGQYYHIWSIPKPNGKRRWIHAPQGRLKRLQRGLVRYLTSFPLHPAARAFQPGKGGHELVVKEHTDFSRGKAWWFEGDIVDFFGHVTTKMLLENNVPNEVVKAITIKHPYRNRGWVLPQGGPTSPPASNIVMREFDKELQEALPEDSLYTRYADNIGISLLTPMERKDIIKLVMELLKKHGFQLNWEKIKYVPPGYGQVFLGIHMDNGELKLPRRFAVDKMRSKMHHFRMGDTTEASKDGMTGYLKMVSPEQFEKERHRHGF